MNKQRLDLINKIIETGCNVNIIFHPVVNGKVKKDAILIKDCPTSVIKIVMANSEGLYPTVQNNGLMI